MYSFCIPTVYISDIDNIYQVMCSFVYYMCFSLFIKYDILFDVMEHCRCGKEYYRFLSISFDGIDIIISNKV